MGWEREKVEGGGGDGDIGAGKTPKNEIFRH
jgi:hypothetical protein